MQSPGVLLAVARLGIQHSHGRLPPPDFLIQSSCLPPQFLRLPVLVPHSGRQFLRLGIELFLFPGCRIPLAHRLLTVREQFSAASTQLFQLLQPDRDFQLPQLVPVTQKLLCPFGLGPQRLHLKLQLRDLVPHPEQILLRAGQLALRLLFPVAIPGNSSGFFKDISTLQPPGRENFIDLSLPDDRVPLFAQTGVHE